LAVRVFDLQTVRADDEPALDDWRQVHNVIVPTDELTADEVRERSQRHRLEVTYLREVLVACTTVRPPILPEGAATVIVRVLPDWRRKGIGSALYERSLGIARGLGAEHIETVIWAANVDGLLFAEKRGYAEVSREESDDDLPFIRLRLST
jgi:GNAT superfamily N-acetyltransferase